MIGNTEWPNLLADLKAKRDALNQVIATIEAHFIPVKGEMPESPTNGRGRTVRRTNRGKAVRPAPATRNGHGLPEEALDAVIVQLRKVNGQSPAQLQAAMKLTPIACRRRVKALFKAKRVEFTGKTASRRVWLPGTAKEGL